MKFRVIQEKVASGAHSPVYVIERETGQGVGWINRYLDREHVRHLAYKSLYSYAHSLLYFVRWWEGVHHTGDISEANLTESTLLDYIRFQSSRQPAPSASTINDRVACADRAIRNEFPDAPCQAAPGFHQVYKSRREVRTNEPTLPGHAGLGLLQVRRFDEVSLRSSMPPQIYAGLFTFVAGRLLDGSR